MGITCCKPNIIENDIPVNNEINNLPYEIPLELKPSDLGKFIPIITRGRVIKCYDADTITIAAIPQNTMDENTEHKYNNIYKFSVRIRGIDTPEIKPKKPKEPATELEKRQYNNEKKIAQIARDKLALMIFGNIVKLENVAYDKYGRILADVYYEDILISEWLLKKRLAVEYDGGTKKKPDCWMKYYTGEC